MVGGLYWMVKGQYIMYCMFKVFGFGFKGIMCYVLLVIVFLKLCDIGQKVFLFYEEIFIGIVMSEVQVVVYNLLKFKLVVELCKVLVMCDSILFGVVFNVLLVWLDCCFCLEMVVYFRLCKMLVMMLVIFVDGEFFFKEFVLLWLCVDQKVKGWCFFIYFVYLGICDMI